jgi:membrane-associated protease RseP (regulator of RpoE activity)
VNSSEYRSRSPSYYLEKIDPEILASFQPEQIEAITSILKQAIPKPSPKIVDFRFTVDLIFSRFYLVLLVGKDFRKEQREYKSRGITKVGNIIAAIILLVATNLTISALILLIAYLFKSAIGIDFFPDHISGTLKKLLGGSK